MDLWTLSSILWRRKWLMLVGVVVGVLLVFLAMYSIAPASSPGGRPRLQRRRYSTYQSQVSFLIDVPGFGVGRTDIPMNKPAEMAPTFAYLATSDAVKRRVANMIGKGKELVTAGAVENSPIFTLVVEGKDPTRVTVVTRAYADAVMAYTTQQQETNGIPDASRLAVRPLGQPSIPKKTASRDVEIAGLLFLGPVILAGLIALTMEGASRRKSASEAATESAEQKSADEQGSERVVLPLKSEDRTRWTS